MFDKNLCSSTWKFDLIWIFEPKIDKETYKKNQFKAQRPSSPSQNQPKPIAPHCQIDHWQQWFFNHLLLSNKVHILSHKLYRLSNKFIKIFQSIIQNFPQTIQIFIQNKQTFSHIVQIYHKIYRLSHKVSRFSHKYTYFLINYQDFSIK